MLTPSRGEVSIPPTRQVLLWVTPTLCPYRTGAYTEHSPLKMISIFSNWLNVDLKTLVTVTQAIHRKGDSHHHQPHQQQHQQHQQHHQHHHHHPLSSHSSASSVVSAVTAAAPTSTPTPTAALTITTCADDEEDIQLIEEIEEVEEIDDVAIDDIEEVHLEEEDVLDDGSLADDADGLLQPSNHHIDDDDDGTAGHDDDDNVQIQVFTISSPVMSADESECEDKEYLGGFRFVSVFFSLNFL